MKQKHIKQIYNLVTPTESNKQMSGDQLREKINLIFINNSRENLGLFNTLFNTLAATGHRNSEVITAKHYLKKAGA